MATRITDPRDIKLISVVVNHDEKKVIFTTPTDTAILPFDDYDEWGTIELDGITVDTHILWDEELTVYLEPLEEDTITGMFKNITGNQVGHSIGFTMNNPLVKQVGSLPVCCEA